MGTSLPQLSPLASAIAQAEGFGASLSNIPTQANNPGDLELGDIGNGTLSASGGNQITVFGSLADGAQALENQLSKIFNGTSSNYSPDMTLSQFGTIYSGGNTSYGNTLATALGTSPSSTLSQVQNGTATQASTSSTSSSGIFNSLLGLATGGTMGSSPFTLSRAIVLILGIILFGAGLLTFRTTQTVIQTATGAAKKAGEIAAL